MKSEATDTADLHKNVSECQQKSATHEDKFKEAKSKLRNWSKSFNKMVEKLDRKEEQLTKFKAKHEEQSMKLKQSAKEIKTLNEKKWQIEQGRKRIKPQNWRNLLSRRHIKDLIVDKDEEIKLLQE